MSSYDSKAHDLAHDLINITDLVLLNRIDRSQFLKRVESLIKEFKETA